MKLYTAQQIRDWDQFTIEHEPIPSVGLMERASETIFEELKALLDPEDVFHVFCASGNNGGDGLAVARMLSEAGYTVKLYIFRLKTSSEDFTINLDKVRKLIPVNELSVEVELPEIEECDVIIDALMGSGLTRPIEGFLGEVIDYLNATEALRVAIDVPSGLYSDEHNADDDCIFQADLTLSLEVPKLSFFYPENENYVGHFEVLPIGLHTGYSAKTPFFYIEKETAYNILQARSKFSHKGTFGHSLLIGGSTGKMGAILLSTQACLRSGSGLVSTIAPKCGYTVLQSQAPEAMCLCDKADYMITEIEPQLEFTAVGIGPGLGKAKLTKEAFLDFIKVCSKPMVLDADALNILAENTDYLKELPPNSILTPHPKEFSRLFGSTPNSPIRFEILRSKAHELNCTIVLKGAHTAIASPNGEVYFNSTGNSGMATGGSGDVLTGFLTGLLAQGYLGIEAAILGVYLHGLAGDYALETQSEESMKAGDLIENFGKAFQLVR